MSAVREPARERPALRVALVAGDPIRHQGLMAIIRGGGHAVVEHHREADVVLVDGDSIDQYGPPVVTLGANLAGVGDVGRGRRSPRVAQRRPRLAAVRRPGPAGPLSCAP